MLRVAALLCRHLCQLLRKQILTCRTCNDGFNDLLCLLLLLLLLLTGTGADVDYRLADPTRLHDRSHGWGRIGRHAAHDDRRWLPCCRGHNLLTLHSGRLLLWRDGVRLQLQLLLNEMLGRCCYRDRLHSGGRWLLLLLDDRLDVCLLRCYNRLNTDHRRRAHLLLLDGCYDGACLRHSPNSLLLLGVLLLLLLLSLLLLLLLLFS